MLQARCYTFLFNMCRGNKGFHTAYEGTQLRPYKSLKGYLQSQVKLNYQHDNAVVYDLSHIKSMKFHKYIPITRTWPDEVLPNYKKSTEDILAPKWQDFCKNEQLLGFVNCRLPSISLLYSTIAKN